MDNNAAFHPMIRRGGGRRTRDLMRQFVLLCVTILSGFTLFKLQYLQNRLDSLDDLYSVSYHLQLSLNMQPLNNNDDDEEEEPSFTKRDGKKVGTSTFHNNNKLPCLVHQPFEIQAPEKRVSDPNQTVLEQITGRCGSLRRQWFSNPPLSGMAKMLEDHQTNCSLPLATHTFDNTFGLGAHYILWGQALCNAVQSQTRMRSRSPVDWWLWMDQQHCDKQQAKLSPMLCYFPRAENRCGKNAQPPPHPTVDRNVSDPRDRKLHCDLVKKTPESRAAYRAAATEFLFQQVSPLVIQEAKRQVGIVFNGETTPKDLVTVHIRWGDKFWEMDLPPIEEYIQAVQNLTGNATDTNIYLSTEDPRAYTEFMNAIPSGWHVYPDITLKEIDAFRPTKGNRASWATRNTKGRAGLVALGSLLVAMEANLFVLTTKSNWSTLMNHLRTNIIDPRCGNCTKAIDLRPGVYF